MKEVLYKYNLEKYSVHEYLDHNTFDNYDILKNSKNNFKLKTTHSSESEYIKNYGNPLCTISKNYAMIVVEKYGDKVSIKLFTGIRNRKKGSTFFRVNKQMTYVTINTKTKNFYSGFLENYHKKRKFRRKLRKNYIKSDPIINFYAVSKTTFDKLSENSFPSIKQGVDVFLKEVFGKDFDKVNYGHILLKYYLDKKTIKYPNNFIVFREFLQYRDFNQILKKNNNKLVDALMEFLNLKGKIIKKVLHNINNLNYDVYFFLKQLFEPWIDQDYDLLLKVFNSNFYHYFSDISYEELNKNSSLEERRRMFNFFKNFVITYKIGLVTFTDHINMFLRLKNYGEPNIKWVCESDLDFFNEQHIDWSEKVDKYKRGTFYRYYPSFMSKFLDEIKCDGEKYCPVLLTNSDDYVEESKTQSNCVRTYIIKPSSIILSLRKGSFESKNRATVEYQIYRDGDKVKLERFQYRGKYNSSLDDSWELPLKMLDNSVNLWIKQGDVSLFKIKKISNVGNEYFFNTSWDDDELVWDNYKLLM